MHPEIQELVERRKALLEDAEQLAGVETMTDDDEKAFDKAMAEVDQLDKKIENMTRIEDAKSRGSKSVGRLVDTARSSIVRTAEVDLDVTNEIPAGRIPQDEVRVLGERIFDSPTFGFEDASEFFTEVWRNGTPGVGSNDERLRVLSAASGASQGSGADLGFLVPPEFSQTIWDGIHQDAQSLLADTDQYTVAGESLTLLANGEKSRANGSRYGGIRGYWISEAAQMTSSKPKLRQAKIEPHELAVLAYVTDKALRNGGPAVGQYVTKAAQDELMFMTGNAIINGTGVGKPLGVMKSKAVVTQAAVSGQGAGTIVAGNIFDMYARLLSRAVVGAKWYINQDTLPQLFRLKDDNGNLIYLPAGRLTDSPFGTMLGLPVVPIEYCQTLGTEGDIILANLGYYITGIRSGGVRSDSSIHVRFEYNETAFRFLTEIDGQPWLNSAITPFKGSNTQSAFVTLSSTRT